MVGAGLLAKKAVERGLTRKPWVKTSLAPGSKVVTEYYEKAGLTPYLEELGFYTVGYGCTTCIGNSGPLPEEISRGVSQGDLVVCAVLSGNRNFEARIHPEVKANYLGSPPLVVAYALAGRMDIDLATEPIGVGSDGEDVFLADIWPSPEEVRETVAGAIGEEMFRSTYADVFTGDETWREPPGSGGRALRLGSELDLRAPSVVLRRDAGRARSGRGHRRSALPRFNRRLGDDGSHLARRDRSSRTPRRGATSSTTASSARSSTRTDRAAGTTR